MLTRNIIDNIELFYKESIYIKFFIDKYLLKKIKELPLEQANNLLIEELNKLYSMKKWFFRELIEELSLKGAIIPSKFLPKTSLNNDKTKISSANLDPQNFFFNKSVLFTGALENFKRKEIKAIIKNMNGILASTVNENLDYLIVGNKPGSKLKKAKSFNNIKIIDEMQFIEMSNGGGISKEEVKDKEMSLKKDIIGLCNYLENNPLVWHEKMNIIEEFNITEEDLNEELFQDYLITKTGIIYWDSLNFTLQEEKSLIENSHDILKMDYHKFKSNYKEFINKNKMLTTIQQCKEIINILIRERGSIC